MAIDAYCMYEWKQFLQDTFLLCNTGLYFLVIDSSQVIFTMTLLKLKFCLLEFKLRLKVSITLFFFYSWHKPFFLRFLNHFKQAKSTTYTKAKKRVIIVLEFIQTHWLQYASPLFLELFLVKQSVRLAPHYSTLSRNQEFRLVMYLS